MTDRSPHRHFVEAYRYVGSYLAQTQRILFDLEKNLEGWQRLRPNGDRFLGTAIPSFIDASTWTPTRLDAFYAPAGALTGQAKYGARADRTPKLMFISLVLDIESEDARPELRLGWIENYRAEGKLETHLERIRGDIAPERLAVAPNLVTDVEQLRFELARVTGPDEQNGPRVAMVRMAISGLGSPSEVRELAKRLLENLRGGAETPD